MLRLTAGLCAVALSAASAAFAQSSTQAALPDALADALGQLEPDLTSRDRLAVLVDWDMSGTCPLLDIFAADVVGEVFDARREVVAADGSARLVPEVEFLTEAAPDAGDVLRVDLTLLDRERGLVELNLELEEAGAVVRRGWAGASVDPRDLDGCVEAVPQAPVGERTADTLPAVPAPDTGAGPGAGIGSPLIDADPDTATGPGAGGDGRAGAIYAAVLDADEAGDAAAFIEGWLADAGEEGSAAPPSTALLVGEVDTVIELRGRDAWRSIRERLESDQQADITYAPEFQNSYVLTGAFRGTDSGFYELVLRDGDQVASVSMHFPVGDDGRAAGETREVVERIACSVHFGRAALPCAR